MFEEFLKPIDLSEIISEKLSDTQLGKIVSFHLEKTFPDLSEIDLAIIGVKEERGAINNQGCSTGVNEIRIELYNLFKGNNKPRIADLGNIERGASLQDTYVALEKIVYELISMKIIPIIIGGSHDLTFAQYLGYKEIKKNISIAIIDERIDLKETIDDANSRSFLLRLIGHPNLFNISQIGYQNYFVDQRAVDIFDAMHFDCIRLGNARERLDELEPMLRDADMVSFDISAIRQSDAPGNQRATPHGFYGEEACQIARYAGLSDKLTSIGFYEYNPAFDKNFQTSQLIAQMVWYFIDGFYNRKKDFPNPEDKEFMKYLVNFKDNDYELVFWKSNRSNRWWVQVPARDNKRNEELMIISCSYNDYQSACKEEVPERWMRAYNRLG